MILFTLWLELSPSKDVDFGASCFGATLVVTRTTETNLSTSDVAFAVFSVRSAVNDVKDD